LIAGGATAALTFGLAVGLRDRDALVLTLALALSLGVATRRPVLGGLALGALLLDVAAWMGLAFVSHLGHDDPTASVVLSGLLVLSSSVGFAALVISLGSRFDHEDAPAAPRRPRPSLGAALGLAWGLAAVIVVAMAPSMVAVPKGGEGRVVISMKNSRFSTNRLESSPGKVTIVVANPDLFWHTFTIPDLDIDVTVPVGSVREATATLPAGSYQYVCRVPGHSRMLGVLVVR
jgi:plastocyanin